MDKVSLVSDYNIIEKYLINLEIIYLNVFYITIDEITTFPRNKELAPIVGSIFGRVLVIYHLFQRLHHGVMCRSEKEWI